MSLSGKLFDKKNGGAGGGNPAANVDGSCIIHYLTLISIHWVFFFPFIVAMHTAASTAMRLCGQYTTTARMNLEPGEMQNLMGAAMSFLSK
jgi:hypothetical protein